MTTPASGAISIGNVRTELGVGGALSMSASNFRAVAADFAGTLSLSQCYGKTRHALVAGTALGFVGYWPAQGAGSLSPNTIKGATVQFLGDNTTGRFLVQLTPPGQSQTLFAQVVINGIIYSTSSVIAFDANEPASGASVWQWAASGIANGSSYNVITN